MRHRIAVALAVALAAGSLTACGGGEPEAAPSRTVLVPGRPGEPNKTALAGPTKAAPPTTAEVGFVQMMIRHHTQAQEMSALAPTRTSNARVRSLADRIGAAQKVEVAAMRSWLEQNPKAVLKAHGQNHAAHTMPGMATTDQLQRLRNAHGPAFDHLYLTLMITHHQGALTMAKNVLDKGTDVTVQQMARDVQSTQNAEIDRLHDLLTEH
ncbi:DUF305 domain-containing protein [Actinomadura meridiana]|uniref:DUF305 domain-containing protein n=1 Tax=Actinomadura meridiana TaxID=559626 RepID=A0ABP8CAS5_9ACTN